MRRPAIYVTRGAIDLLDAGELRAALAHELAHLGRRDPERSWVMLGLRCVMGWNPTFQVLARALARDAERLADERGVELGADRLALASALLKLHRATGGMDGRRTLFFGGALAGTLRRARSQDLERRVRELLEPAPRAAAAALAAARPGGHLDDRAALLRHMTAPAQTRRAVAPELLRMLVALGWVVATTAVTLAGLGALPGLIAGEPHEVRTVASVEIAERNLGAGLALPSYFPAHLGWPPARIRVAGGKGGAVELTFRQRADGGDQLQLLQATTADSPIPAIFEPPGSELASSPTTVAGRPARLSRRTIGGEVWHQLSWERDGRQMVLRTRGDVDELFRIARSAHRRGAP